MFVDDSHQVHETEVSLPLPTITAFQSESVAFGDRYVLAYPDITQGSSVILLTDGSATTRLDVPSRSVDIHAIGEKLHYTFQNEDGRREFYATDGTPEGTELYFRSEAQFVPFAPDAVQVAGDDGTNIYLKTTEAIWKSDGTALGTLRLADLPQTIRTQTTTLITSDDTLLFSQLDPVVGSELFHVSTTIQPLAADTDQDFDVDFADFLALADNFGKEADAVFAEGDLNSDGAVNFDDFLVLSNQFGEDLKRTLT